MYHNSIFGSVLQLSSGILHVSFSDPGCERCGDAMVVLLDIDRPRLRAFAHHQFMAWIRREVDPYTPRDVLREHQLTVVLLGQPLETAGDVDGIPHRGQGGRLGIAHPADDSWAGVDANAHAERFR